jgi:hypothetical protein
MWTPTIRSRPLTNTRPGAADRSGNNLVELTPCFRKGGANRNSEPSREPTQDQSCFRHCRRDCRYRAGGLLPLPASHLARRNHQALRGRSSKRRRQVRALRCDNSPQRHRDTEEKGKRRKAKVSILILSSLYFFSVSLCLCSESQSCYSTFVTGVRAEMPFSLNASIWK